MTQLLITAALMIAFIGIFLWLGHRQLTRPRPPSPLADYRTHLRFWLEAAAIEGFYPGSGYDRVAAWAKQIPSPQVREEIISILA